MTAALDPLGFAATDLAARGALIDAVSPGVITALVPPAVAAALGVPELAMLTETPTADAIFAGLGSPLLDALVAEVRRGPAVAQVRWLAEPPRAAAAEAAATRLVVRNAVGDVVNVGTSTATYLMPTFAWIAEADDRYQGLAAVIADAATGAAPDLAVEAALEAVDVEAGPAVKVADAIGATLIERGRRAAELALAPIVMAVARRRDREAHRQREYFRQLVAEARRPRRQIAPAAIAARVAAIEAEAAAKRDELDARYHLRASISVATLAVITVRVAEVALRVRRRKGERTLALHLPPQARQIDALPCAACAATTRAIVLCDDALHILCEVCAPVATGRPTCAACARGRR